MPKQWTGNRRAELPPNWPAIRAAVLERDGHQCRAQEDSQRCTATATDVDHIGDRDNHHPDNLQALCGQHHQRKTSAQGNTERARLRAQLHLPRTTHPGLLDG